MSDVAEFHPPIEEYLEAIHELEEEGTTVIQARLAERLRHSAPSVSEMVTRLERDGYLARDGRTLKLTRSGQRRAESVVRKHRLAERLLTDVIGMPWHEAHIEACRWEHVISDAVEARLVELLGHPTTCPHGNPIPGAGGATIEMTSLAASQPGDAVTLERLTEQVEIDHDALVYLDTHNFRPGTKATVRAKAPDGTLTLDVDGDAVAVGRSLAEQLYVAVS